MVNNLINNGAGVANGTPLYTVCGDLCYSYPAAAISGNTMLRWIQNVSSEHVRITGDLTIFLLMPVRV